MWQLLHVFFLATFYMLLRRPVYHLKLELGQGNYSLLKYILDFHIHRLELTFRQFLENSENCGGVEIRYVVMKLFVMGPLHAKTSILSKMLLLVEQLKN